MRISRGERLLIVCSSGAVIALLLDNLICWLVADQQERFTRELAACFADDGIADNRRELLAILIKRAKDYGTDQGSQGQDETQTTGGEGTAENPDAAGREDVSGDSAVDRGGEISGAAGNPPR